MVIKTRSKLTLHPVAFPPTKLQTQNDDDDDNNNNNNNDDDDDDDDDEEDNNDKNNNSKSDDDDNDNKIRNMVSLKLGKEIEKDLLCSPQSLCGSLVENRSSKVQFVKGTQNFFSAPHLVVTRRKHLSLQ